MRRVHRTRSKLDQEGLIRRQRVDAIDIVDGFVGHRRHQVPAGLSDIGIDRRGVLDQVARLPLVGVAAHEAVEIFKAHAGRPLIERAGLAGLIFGGVVVLAEPGGVVAVVLQDPADRGLVLGDDAVVAGIAGGLLGDHAVADRMMVAAGDQGGAGRRTQRRRMEVGEAQPVLGYPVERRRRNHAAEGRGNAVAGIVGDDQEDIGCALRWHDTRRPIGRRLCRLAVDLAAEFLGWRRKLVARNCRRRAG
jgi:hypothetical protein